VIRFFAKQGVIPMIQTKSSRLRAAAINCFNGVAILQILAATLLIAVCAHIKIPLYFTPVPLSGQTLAILFIGATLGSRKGALSILAYLLEGAIGLPVFVGGSGILYMFGPTGGYMLGWILQAYLIGKTVESSQERGLIKLFAMMLAICALQLSIGTLWLSNFVGASNSVAMGIIPFIPGEAIKCFLVALYIRNQKK
jgi:biotin transport system substrate-specific component